MLSTKKLINIAGWTVFAVAAIVYFMTAERVGSLWDCGEFILGAYKLEVVHPPGAPLFMIIGRLFTVIGGIFSSDPAVIALSVNLMSGICTAFSAMFVAFTTSILAKKTIKKQDDELSMGESYAVAGAGLVAGLISAFCTSVWFSAVEGEVYAMSTFFTSMTIWSAVKWYSLPNKSTNDRWLVFALFSAGLSVGVHLLSLLVLPALGLLFYYKKFEKRNILGALASIVGGLAYMVFIQKFIIVGVPSLWKSLELVCVNGFGMPFNSGLIPLTLIIGGLIAGLLFLSNKRKLYYLQLFTIIATLNLIGFSLIGVIVIRANADTPVNMNVPSDAMRLLPYINREQYGDRPLLYGPHFLAEPIPGKQKIEKVYGKKGDKYVHVSDKVSYTYRNKDKMLFPRMADRTPSRKVIYNLWREKPAQSEKAPTFFENLDFMFSYQINWMYKRYFFWNFVGRQNGDQGYFKWDSASGNWRSGIGFIDNMILYDTEFEPSRLKDSKANNNYYFLPLIFGFIGLFWHMLKRPKDFIFLFMLFVITGIGIIIYSNQPPNEPRERDYVLVGSFMTFAMWAGMAVMALFNVLKNRANLAGPLSAGLAALVIGVAPIIMLQQNFDDHDRSGITASRDYASNFLNSLEPNAIIFTYGDNDTYPLWYAQEVEGIRTDVRVVNLSLIAVDWYINKLRNKVNDSPPLKLTISEENYTGFNRNVVVFDDKNQLYPLSDALKVVNSDRRLPQYRADMKGYFPSKKLFIKPDRQKAIAAGLMTVNDPDPEPIVFNYPGRQYLLKDDLAIIDIISSNFYDRPIYFAVTCENSKLQGINDYMSLEGLALRIVPFKSKGVADGGVAYSGSVNANKIYDNVMNKWKWGNFDKEDLFVDDSYSASLLAMRSVMKRAAANLYQTGNKQKSIELTKKYFEAFPDYNFHYTYDVSPFIDILVRQDADDEAKKHIRILANEARENLIFFESIDPEIVEKSFTFRQDMQRYLAAANDVVRFAREIGDQTFTTEIENTVGQFLSTRQQIKD